MKKKLLYTPRFAKDYQRLPAKIQVAFEKQLKLLLSNPDHPSLDLKKMKDPRNIWRIKVTAGYRLTLHIEGDVYVFRRIGSHDIERQP